MKKLFYLFVGIVLSFHTSAQLQNLDFEQWDFPVTFADPALNRPTGWICSNRWFGFDEVATSDRFVRPTDDNAQSNDYALSLFTYYNYMKDAAVQIAPIDHRPSSLQGFYKYEENFIIWGTANYLDTAQVVVTLTKWNPVLSKTELIGRGKFSTYQSTPVFKPFEVNIEYYSTEQPDSITILLDPSVLGRYPDRELQNEAHGGRSVFTIDNLALSTEGTAGLEESNDNRSLVIYPNPAMDQISFETMSGELTISDLTGKQVLNTHLHNTGTLDVSRLNKGMFTFHIQDEKGIHTGRFIKW